MVDVVEAEFGLGGLAAGVVVVVVAVEDEEFAASDAIMLLNVATGD